MQKHSRGDNIPSLETHKDYTLNPADLFVLQANFYTAIDTLSIDNAIASNCSVNQTAIPADNRLKLSHSGR
jgi:hypothetical protein